MARKGFTKMSEVTVYLDLIDIMLETNKIHRKNLTDSERDILVTQTWFRLQELEIKPSKRIEALRIEMEYRNDWLRKRHEQAAERDRLITEAYFILRAQGLKPKDCLALLQ